MGHLSERYRHKQSV